MSYPRELVSYGRIRRSRCNYGAGRTLKRVIESRLRIVDHLGLISKHRSHDYYFLPRDYRLAARIRVTGLDII